MPSINFPHVLVAATAASLAASDSAPAYASSWPAASNVENKGGRRRQRRATGATEFPMARTVHEMVLTTPVAGINTQQIVEPKNFNPSLTKSGLVVLDSVVQASVENGGP